MDECQQYDTGLNMDVVMNAFNVGAISANTRMVMTEMPKWTVIEKVVARTMGLTAYRDGKYCPEGHQGWKYIANDKCVTCGENK